MHKLNTRLHHWLTLLHSQPIGTTFTREILNAYANHDQTIINKVISANTDLMPPLIEQDLAWANTQANHIIPFDDPRYPPQLQEIATPPPVLFIRGNLANLKNQQLAIVGSRNPSHSGIENAYAFAKELGQIGLTVTSGLAIGIDAASHKGAVETEGNTIAVLGTGINKIYPQQHIPLAQKILANGGTLVTEFPPNTTPKPTYFPRRNRIISGLSLGVLVVEATLRSGSLITARFAIEQNREVFALPGSIHDPLTKGCHQLIRQGAKLVETITDIIEELPLASLTPAHDASITHNQSCNLNNEITLAKNHQKLLECIRFECTSVDTLIKRSKLMPREIIKILTILELNGLIRAEFGGYVKVHK